MTGRAGKCVGVGFFGDKVVGEDAEQGRDVIARLRQNRSCVRGLSFVAILSGWLLGLHAGHICKLSVGAGCVNNGIKQAS